MSREIKIGNYILEEPLGRGGMGVVYRGRHAKLPRRVAIKSVSARASSDLRRQRQRFEREAYVQSQLDHPGVVKIYDYVVAEQTYYIVMEYVEGHSLATLMERASLRPDLERALDLFEQILCAAAYAHSFTYRDERGALHRGIVHRDLKPQNILVTPEGRVKVADFGLVKLVGDDAGETSSGTVYGSPLYVSPEQAEGTAVDTRSDIYSLGVILYELLTGVAPFGGGDEKLSRTEILRAHVERVPRPPSELNPAVPEELSRVVCRALEKKPERRFASAYDFWRALRRARGRETADIVEPSPHVSSAPEEAGGGEALAGVSADEGAASAGGATTGLPRDSYLTQPIHPARCEACGAQPEEGDRRCRACGHDLSASPATAALARREVAARRGRSRLRLFAPLAALALLCGAALFFVARRERAEVTTDSRPAATSPASPSPRATAEGPPPQLVELRPARVQVDSSFDGYGAEPLTDGLTDVRRIAAMRYNRGNWASAETPVPHWIEVDFGREARVSAVYVYWGFDRDRFTPSRRVELQTPDGRGGWQTVSTMQPGGDFDRTAFEFAPVTTERVRIFQPAQQGPAGRPFVMWVREVQVFGAAGDS